MRGLPATLRVLQYDHKAGSDLPARRPQIGPASIGPGATRSGKVTGQSSSHSALRQLVRILARSAALEYLAAPVPRGGRR